MYHDVSCLFGAICRTAPPGRSSTSPEHRPKGLPLIVPLVNVIFQLVSQLRFSQDFCRTPGVRCPDQAQNTSNLSSTTQIRNQALIPIVGDQRRSHSTPSYGSESSGTSAHHRETLRSAKQTMTNKKSRKTSKKINGHEMYVVRQLPTSTGATTIVTFENSDDSHNPRTRLETGYKNYTTRQEQPLACSLSTQPSITTLTHLTILLAHTSPVTLAHRRHSSLPGDSRL